MNEKPVVPVKGFKIGFRRGEFYITWIMEEEGNDTREAKEVVLFLSPVFAKRLSFLLRRELEKWMEDHPASYSSLEGYGRKETLPSRVLRALYKSKPLTTHLRLINTKHRKKLPDQ